MDDNELRNRLEILDTKINNIIDILEDAQEEEYEYNTEYEAEEEQQQKIKRKKEEE